MTRSNGSFGGDVGANAARAARWELGAFSATLIDAASELPVTEGVRRYVHLDNAATAPALAAVKRAVERVLPFHAAIHRGAGFKNEISTELYQRCRSEVAAFIGGDRRRTGSSSGRVRASSSTSRRTVSPSGATTS